MSMELECSAACHGSGVLRDIASGHAAAASRGAVLASFKFKLRASGAMTIRAKLTPSGRKLASITRPLIADVTIVFSAGSGRPVTFVSALDVTRTTPATARKAGLRRGTIVLHRLPG